MLCYISHISLYCMMLFYIVPYRIILCYIRLYFIAVYSILRYYIVGHYRMLALGSVGVNLRELAH